MISDNSSFLSQNSGNGLIVLIGGKENSGWPRNNNKKQNLRKNFWPTSYVALSCGLFSCGLLNKDEMNHKCVYHNGCIYTEC